MKIEIEGAVVVFVLEILVSAAVDESAANSSVLVGFSATLGLWFFAGSASPFPRLFEEIF